MATSPNHRSYRSLTLAVSAVSLLVLGLSIACIVTSTLALRVRDDLARRRRVPREVIVGDVPSLTGWYYYALPNSIRYGNERAVLGASVGILIWVLLPLFTSFFEGTPLHPKSKWTPSFGRSSLFLSGCCFIGALIAVIYSNAAIPYTTIRTSGFEETEPPSGAGSILGATGVFGVESWTCQIRHVVRFFEYDTYNNPCHLARAARWTTVALLIVTALLVVLTFLALRRGNKLVRSKGKADRTPLAVSEYVTVKDTRTAEP